VEVRTLEHLGEILARAGTKKRLELEIGCGNGHFLSRYAEKNNDSFFLGVELKKKRCLKVVKKIERLGIDNVEIVCGNAFTLLSKLPEKSVDTCHIYFPDPWPKTKHRKKRLIRKPTLDLLSATMKDGGRLYFSTDFFDYSVQAKLLFLLDDRYKVVDKDPPGEIFLSVFANKFVTANKPIYFITVEKYASAEH
jgi:tRNA (guanine-N7-)-methyltransferase